MHSMGGGVRTSRADPKPKPKPKPKPHPVGPRAKKNPSDPEFIVRSDKIIHHPEFHHFQHPQIDLATAGLSVPSPTFNNHRLILLRGPWQQLE